MTITLAGLAVDGVEWIDFDLRGGAMDVKWRELATVKRHQLGYACFRLSVLDLVPLQSLMRLGPATGAPVAAGARLRDLANWTMEVGVESLVEDPSPLIARHLRQGLARAAGGRPFLFS